MMIKVLSLTGEELELDVEPDDTIESVKSKVEEREGELSHVTTRCP